MDRFKWRLVAAAVAAVGISVLAIAVVKAGFACANTNKRAAMKIVEANGCIEFWFNRYQSLIGNALTAAVAGVTLLWIARQLEVSHRESAISAASALRVRVGELGAEGDAMALLLPQFWRFGQFDEVVSVGEPPFGGTTHIRDSSVLFDTAFGASENPRAEIDELIAELRKIEFELARYSVAGDGDEVEVQRLRNEFEDAVIDCAIAADEMVRGMPAHGVRKELFNELLLAYLKARRILEQLNSWLGDEYAATWATIRKLERRAIADR